MKVFLCVTTALFGIVLAGPAPQRQAVPEDDEPVKSFLVETSPGVYEVEDLENGEIDVRVSERDLVYHFYTRTDPNIGIDITSDRINDLGYSRFSTSKDTVFIIHGWKGDNVSDFNNNVRQALLSANDINLFAVDWSPIADRGYITAKGSMVAVGRVAGAFINSLVNVYGLDLSRVTLVGFSLGAHVAGTTGSALNGRVGAIVGLDPAGPLFSTGNTAERLDPTDGQFVHVIHTNGGLQGFSHASGHVDFYPNGGSSQAGCGLDLLGGCAHARAYEYYSESVASRSSLFVARRCSNQRDHDRGQCSSNPQALQGEYPTDTRATQGTYYLNTNGNSPFARG